MTFRVDQYLQAGKLNKINLTVKISLDGGITIKPVARSWTVEVINLGLEWNYNYSYINYIGTDTFDISWKPKGSIDCETYINFYNSLGEKMKDSTVVQVPANKTDQ
jgi:hypothetical protein